jgi:hypothetical protein
MTIYTDSKEDIKSKKGSQIHESNSTKKVWRIVDTTTNSLTRLSNQQRLMVCDIKEFDKTLMHIR